MEYSIVNYARKARAGSVISGARMALAGNKTRAEAASKPQAPSPAVESAAELIKMQLSRLGEEHFLALYWATVSEYKSVAYNITNYFDDLKHLGLTRTKQTAMAAIEAMRLLGLIDLRDSRNRKNIFITHFGASALQHLVKSGNFTSKPSEYLESTSK